MKILLSLFLVVLSLFGRADLDEYAHKMGFERNYYTALSKAKEEHQPLMLIVTKPECPWCDRLEDKTLTNSKVHKRLLKEAITVLVYKDFDEDDYPAQIFQTPFSPRTFFIDPQTQKTLLIINGYVNVNKFLQKLNTLKTLWNK